MGGGVDEALNLADGGGDLFQSADDLIGQGLHAGDLGRDAFGGGAGLGGQLLDLVGDDGKAFTGITGARRFDRGVERQQIDLAGDLGNQLDDAGHGLGSLAHFTGRAVGGRGTDVDFVDRVLGAHHVIGDFADAGIHLFGGRGNGFDIAQRVFGGFDSARTGTHAGSDIGGIFDDLDRLARRVEDRIIGRLQPNLLTILAEALVDGRHRLARAQFFPESLVFLALGVGRRDEQAVMLALDVFQLIAGGGQEVGVGFENDPVQGKSDDRLGAVDGGDLAFVIGVAPLFVGDVHGELDDLERLAVTAEDRVVGGADPHVAAALGDAPVFRGLEQALAQALPELVVFVGRRLLRGDEHAMMLADDFVMRIAHDGKEVVVGVENGAVHGEGDDGL